MEVGHRTRRRRGFRINEVMASDEGGQIIDEPGRIGDWVELVNTGDTAVDISGPTPSRTGPTPAHRSPTCCWARERRSCSGRMATPTGGTPTSTSRSPPRATAHPARRGRRGGGRGDDARGRPQRGLRPHPGRRRDAGRAAATRRRRGEWRPLRAAAPARSPRRAPLRSLHLARRADGARAAGDQRGGAAPARFIEVANGGTATLTLGDFVLRLAPLHPGERCRPPTAGAALAWPVATLAPGARVAVPVAGRGRGARSTADPGGRGGRGAVPERQTERCCDRVDLMRLPEGAALARAATAAGRARPRRWQFCTDATPGSVTATCDAVAARDVGDRVRTACGRRATSRRWPTAPPSSAACREVRRRPAGGRRRALPGDPALAAALHVHARAHLPPAALDRCDPVQARVRRGLVDFSNREYLQRDSRRFLLGTLVH